MTKKYTYSPEEKETLISFSDASDTCRIYTCNKSLINKLNLLSTNYPDTYKCIDEDEHSKTYITSKNLISIRKPKTISDEYRVKLQENAKKMRESNSNNE